MTLIIYVGTLLLIAYRKNTILSLILLTLSVNFDRL